MDLLLEPSVFYYKPEWVTLRGGAVMKWVHMYRGEQQESSGRSVVGSNVWSSLWAEWLGWS
jgi:hypothetical protein